MDKKTCMILLGGLIFVVLLTNTGSYLEGLETSAESGMQDSIDGIKPDLADRQEQLDSDPGMTSNSMVMDNYTDTATQITGLQSQYSDLDTEHTTTSNNIDDNSTTMTYTTGDLTNQFNILNGEIENIDTSLEKMKDSKVTYTEYQYQSVVWAIVALGLGVACITTIM
tara:strand:- start:696 stop:1199 length:504 start_codon:yes stop_codon:yes gene_type:complete